MSGAADSQSLAVAPTGLPADFAQRIFADDGGGAALLTAALDAAFGAYNDDERRFEVVESKRLSRPESLAIVRTIHGDDPVTLQTVFADRSRGVAIGRGHDVDFGWREFLPEDLVETLLAQLAAARSLLLSVGAHGDLRFRCSYSFRADQTLRWRGRGRVAPQRLAIGNATIEGWTTLDSDAERDDALAREVMAELARAGGAGP
jgi:hypothetical protein